MKVAESSAHRSFAQIERNFPSCLIASAFAGLVMSARHLHQVPILSVITLADDKIYIVRKVFWILVVESPLIIVIAMQKFACGAVGNTDLP